MNPETQEEWQALFDSYFKESGVLVTRANDALNPDATQMVGLNVFIIEIEDDHPLAVIPNVLNGYPYHFYVDGYAVAEDGAVLTVAGHRPGPDAESVDLILSNRLTEQQKAIVAAEQV